MSATPTLYRIGPTERRDAVDVEEVWRQSGAGPLPGDCAQVVPLTVAGATHLLATEPKGGPATLLQPTSGPPWIAHAGERDLGGPYDVLAPFELGGVTYLLAYTAEGGDFSIFPLSADVEPAAPYRFYRSRPPGVTKGFTSVQPLVVNSGLYVLGYSFDTGDVAMYSVAATPSAPVGSPGQPPLLALPVWDHRWATHWTRFAFFRFGAENFFFKINVGKLNVNIDHVLDDPSQGTVEVASHLHLDDALAIDLVASFELGAGEPYLLTYMTDGTTTFERFHADCQGWTRVAAETTVTGATQAVPYRLGDQTFALFV